MVDNAHNKENEQAVIRGLKKLNLEMKKSHPIAELHDITFDQKGYLMFDGVLARSNDGRKIKVEFKVGSVVNNKTFILEDDKGNKEEQKWKLASSVMENLDKKGSDPLEELNKELVKSVNSRFLDPTKLFFDYKGHLMLDGKKAITPEQESVTVEFFANYREGCSTISTKDGVKHFYIIEDQSDVIWKPSDIGLEIQKKIYLDTEVLSKLVSEEELEKWGVSINSPGDLKYADFYVAARNGGPIICKIPESVTVVSDNQTIDVKDVAPKETEVVTFANNEGNIISLEEIKIALRYLNHTREDRMSGDKLLISCHNLQRILNKDEDLVACTEDRNYPLPVKVMYTNGGPISIGISQTTGEIPRRYIQSSIKFVRKDDGAIGFSTVKDNGESKILSFPQGVKLLQEALKEAMLPSTKLHEAPPSTELNQTQSAEQVSSKDKLR